MTLDFGAEPDFAAGRFHVAAGSEDGRLAGPVGPSNPIRWPGSIRQLTVSSSSGPRNPIVRSLIVTIAMGQSSHFVTDRGLPSHGAALQRSRASLSCVPTALGAIDPGLHGETRNRYSWTQCTCTSTQSLVPGPTNRRLANACCSCQPT